MTSRSVRWFALMTLKRNSCLMEPVLQICLEHPPSHPKSVVLVCPTPLCPCAMRHHHPPEPARTRTPELPALPHIPTMHRNVKLSLLLPRCICHQASVASCVGHLRLGDAQPPPLLRKQEPIPTSHRLPVLHPRHRGQWCPRGLTLQNRLTSLDDRNLPRGFAAALDPRQPCGQRDRGWRLCCSDSLGRTQVDVQTPSAWMVAAGG